MTIVQSKSAAVINLYPLKLIEIKNQSLLRTKYMFPNDPKPSIGTSYLIIKQKELRKRSENKRISNSLRHAYVNTKAIECMRQEKELSFYLKCVKKLGSYTQKKKNNAHNEGVVFKVSLRQ